MHIRKIYIRNPYELGKEVIELNNAFKAPLKNTEIRAVLRCIPKSIKKLIAYEQKCMKTIIGMIRSMNEKMKTD